MNPVSNGQTRDAGKAFLSARTTGIPVSAWLPAAPV
jgi:hypothetical protein